MAKALKKKKRLSAKEVVSPGATVQPFSIGALAASWQSWLPRVSLLVVVTFWVYWPALRGDWIWDDNFYYASNPLLHEPGRLWKAWFEPSSFIEYYPILESVQWVQWHLWHGNTLGYHLTNLALHILGALLVWRLLGKLGLRLAWLGGLLFAVHPVQVESVAWICELKNTLSLPPFLLTMCFYLDYEEKGQSRDYWWAFGFFVATMLCKISVAPFPLVILLYAWWKRGGIRRHDLLVSAPFFAVSNALGAAGVYLASAYNHLHSLDDTMKLSLGDTEQGGWLAKAALAGWSLAFYFAQCIGPVKLMLIYPQWPMDRSALLQFAPWLVLGGVLYGLWTMRQTWGRHALLGLGFFLVMILPLAFIHWDFTWVMDHFLYIPIIGVIGLVVAAFEQVEGRLSVPVLRWGVGFVAALVAFLAWEGHAYAAVFANEEVLWGYTLRCNPAAWIASSNLGGYFAQKKRFAEALVQLNEAVRLKPDFDLAHYNLGIALDGLGRIPEAEEQYRETITLNPAYATAYLNLGEIMRRKGKMAEAEELFRQGHKIAPDDVLLCTDLGGLLLQSGRIQEAIDLYSRVVELDPDQAQLRYNLGNVLLQAGDIPEAVGQLQAAVQLDPQVAAAHENLGVALARSGRLPEAIQQFEAVLELDPARVDARDNLGLALAQTGHLPEAMEQFEQALQQNPGDTNAAQSLKKLQDYELQLGTAGKK